MALSNVSPGDPHAVAHNAERAAINDLEVKANLPTRPSDRAFFPITKALSSGTARIVAMGDSKTEGTGLEKTTDRWINKLQDILRDQYGKEDTGFGYMPAKYGTFYDFQDGPVATGTTSVYSSQTFGLGQRIVKMELGSTITFPAMTFDSAVPLVVHYVRTSVLPVGELEVLTDGVVRQTINTSGTGFSSQKVDVTIPSGTTQVVIRPKDGTNPVLVEGIFNQTSTSGIKVIDGSKSGAKFSQFDEAASWNAVAMYEPHGYILAFGANDMSEKTPAQMAVDARAVVDRCLNVSPLAGVVILHGSERTQTPQSGKVREFEAVMRTEFSEDPQVSILYESDLWLPKAGADYTWGGPEGWLVDTVHTSANAHTSIAKYLASYMQPPTPPAQEITWDSVQSKPSSFTPSAHTHEVTDLSGTTNTGRSFLSLRSREEARAYVGDIVNSINGTDLDTMVQAGVFFLDGNTSPNANVPPDPAPRGYLEVVRHSSSYVLQRWTKISDASVTYQRVLYGTWRPWTKYVPDDDPRLMKDTGWRDVSSLADPDVFDFTTAVAGGSYLRWRRIGSTVHLSVRVPLAASTVGTPVVDRRNGLVNGSLAVLGLPANPYIAIGYVDFASNAMCSLTNSSTAVRLDVRPIVATGNVPSSIISRIIGGSVSWITDSSWPTTLPGTPA